LLASLAEGATEAEIRADFPTVTPEAIRAVIAFAAASAEEDLPVAALPTPA
jgi:uncharacterized protein (DUF433 family)